MDNKEILENIKQHIGIESKEAIWENARQIYEQCCGKKYLMYFSNQQEFAEFLGISRGRISQYRYAYEYYLSCKNEIDLKKYTVEQVYLFHRYLGALLFDFLEWTEKEKNVCCENEGLKKTKELVEEYINFKRGVKNDDSSNNISYDELTEHEKKIISFYRCGTDEQRKLIDTILEKGEN